MIDSPYHTVIPTLTKQFLFFASNYKNVQYRPPPPSPKTVPVTQLSVFVHCKVNVNLVHHSLTMIHPKAHNLAVVGALQLLTHNKNPTIRVRYNHSFSIDEHVSCIAMR